MLFSPFKKHANRFRYTPRYYDPAKEEREQRRAELHGQRSDDADREYVPGQYIRTQREARAARRLTDRRSGGSKIWILVGVGIIIMLFVYRMFPVVVSALGDKPRTAVAEEEFDPYAPIVIVPNDYNE